MGPRRLLRGTPCNEQRSSGSTCCTPVGAYKLTRCSLRLAAAQGSYERMAALQELSAEVEVVSIGKKGKRSEQETLRESDPDFRLAQRFRAGVEGTISFLKRILGLFRCFNKGWEHYVSTVGASIFTHNLLILTRT